MSRTSDRELAIRAWIDEHGFTLRVLNGGHHWLIQKPGFVAEWWPSSAKLALNRHYDRTYHAPHWDDVANQLLRHLPDHSQGSLGLNISGARAPNQIELPRNEPRR
jgi:hypothetical protein